MNGNTDSLERFKTYVVYGTAATLVVGGTILLGALIVLKYVPAEVGLASAMLLIGGAAQFLFGALNQKQAEQAIERANLVARSTVNGYIQAPNAPTSPAPTNHPGGNDPQGGGVDGG